MEKEKARLRLKQKTRKFNKKREAKIERVPERHIKEVMPLYPLVYRLLLYLL